MKLSDWLSIAAIVASPIFALVVFWMTEKIKAIHSLEKHRNSLCQILDNQIAEIMVPIATLNKISRDIISNRYWVGSFFNPKTIVVLSENMALIDPVNANHYFHLLSKTQMVIKGIEKLDKYLNLQFEINAKEKTSALKKVIHAQSLMTAKDFVDYAIAAKNVIEVFNRKELNTIIKTSNQEIRKAQEYLNAWSNKTIQPTVNPPLPTGRSGSTAADG